MEITTGVAPSTELAGRVRDRAGGNPLFVAELARLAGERGVADERTVPHAVRDVVRGRLAQLPERATAELEVAAVLGERFELRTAMAASERDPDACLDALDAAIVTRILVPDGDGYPLRPRPRARCRSRRGLVAAAGAAAPPCRRGDRRDAR